MNGNISSKNKIKQIFIYTGGLLLTAGLVIYTLSFIQKSEIQKNSNILPAPTPLPTNIRKPAVQGKFYPEKEEDLDNKLVSLLETSSYIENTEKIRILIAPHAGLEYSGEVAASGFKQIEGQNYSKVFILGSNHNAAHDHIAVYKSGQWETLLGSTQIDEKAAGFLISEKYKILDDPSSHEKEHSLELELIFLQKVLKDFKIIPILLGQPTDEQIEILAERISLLVDDETLIVVSTDLSHYPTWKTANFVDNQTINAILKGNLNNFENEINDIKNKNYSELSTSACGYQALRVSLRIAEILGISNIQNIKYQNSGDITGNLEKVVGYASIIGLSDSLPEKILDENAKEEALQISKDTLHSFIESQEIPLISTNTLSLMQPLGAFVTLEKQDQLRGCMGKFDPSDPLYKVIQDQTIISATKDPRFTPVTQEELEDISIEISVLSPRKEISNWQDIQLGKHGVTIRKGVNSGTFLPQVAIDNDWGLEKFLNELCTQKARLAENCYQDPSVNLFVFEAEVFE